MRKNWNGNDKQIERDSLVTRRPYEKSDRQAQPDQHSDRTRRNPGKGIQIPEF